ncbi:MAG: hypothetical protein O2967_06690 [Proteobacteria bacterium]|nr:hypothetical protein [Pseudomonadota bacterium]
MPMRIVLLSIFLSAASYGLYAVDARAAPQVLALLSTQGEVQLACNGGQCAATFSSYCLQNERVSPPGGTAYELAGADDIRVTGFEPQGRQIRLDALQVLTITALRSQVAVRISIAESRLAELGLSRVSVEVGENVTLVPISQAGDGNPLSDAEIILAKETLRLAGSRIVDADRVRTATVRWLSRLVNALPEDRGGEAMVRDGLVQAAVSGSAMGRLSRAARNLAHGALASCGLDVQLRIYPSLRGCLESAHDAHLWNLNADYWQAIQTGS